MAVLVIGCTTGPETVLAVKLVSPGGTVWLHATKDEEAFHLDKAQCDEQTRQHLAELPPPECDTNGVYKIRCSGESTQIWLEAIRPFDSCMYSRGWLREGFPKPRR
jgi:hypothetical protein